MAQSSLHSLFAVADKQFDGNRRPVGRFLNHGEKKMLTYIKLDDKLIDKLSQLEFEEDWV